MSLISTESTLKERAYLSSPTMHGSEMEYIQHAFDTNWITTIGENVDEVERLAAEQSGMRYAVALTCCTAALHLSVKLAGKKLYGAPPVGQGVLAGKKVFCSDMTFVASMNPVTYEGGIPVIIETDPTSLNMDPAALEKAFQLYPDVKLVVCVELYGFPGKITEIKKICEAHGALLIEDAAEALGAVADGKPCGSIGDYGVISYNGNKIITGSSGGCFLTNNADDAQQIRKWSTQARDLAPWYQHSEIGYNYRMSNIIAGIIRGQYPYLQEHIQKKKAIYERYKAAFADLPVSMNPLTESTEPNYWLSVLIIDPDAMCKQVRSETDADFCSEPGKTCPAEILGKLADINAEGRPIWKPMHMQPIYKKFDFIGPKGKIRADENDLSSVSADIFHRGCCLPSDIKMTAEQQDLIIETIRKCFQ